jgi:hypothetical protein
MAHSEVASASVVQKEKNYGPVRKAVFLAYKPAVADLL